MAIRTFNYFINHIIFISFKFIYFNFTKYYYLQGETSKGTRKREGIEEDVQYMETDEIDYEFLIEYIAKNGPITLCKEHCIEGTAGWAFPTRLIKSVNNWSINKKRLYSIQKVNDIPLIDTKSIISNESVLNERPFWRVVDYEKIYIAGFFKDTVIAKSIKDLVSTGMYDDKLVFLESCIGTINDKAESLKIIEDAIEHHGARVIKK